jgi:hypothetical protein
MLIEDGAYEIFALRGRRKLENQLGLEAEYAQEPCTSSAQPNLQLDCVKEVS